MIDSISAFVKPILSAPNAFNALTPPPYPQANSAIFPFARSSLFTPCFSTGTLNIAVALAQYISPPSENIFIRHFSSANHAIILASIAEKSATINLLPDSAINAVLISWDNISEGFS